MTYAALGPSALNYAPCRYGHSRLLFRGPKRRMDAPYVAFIGGTDTYGKFINVPFPALVESDLGLNCINLGVTNAGIDVILHDGVLSDVANGARATVLQVVGAHNLSNRFYTVHPRRNDRFLTASPLLKSIYPEVDFAEFHFNRHMLSMLFETSQERFGVVVREVQDAWVARMKMFLRRLRSETLILWLADHPPVEEEDVLSDPASGTEPLFITREMLDGLMAHSAGYVEVTASQAALDAGNEGMVFNEMEALAAEKLLGPKAHGEAALQLGAALKPLVE